MIQFNLIKNYYLPTYLWITQSFTEVFAWIKGGENQGTIDTLSKMLLFPNGWGMVFGEGFRLYGNSMGYIHSDIGYVNDMFMGGLIYCTILYITIFRYLADFKSRTMIMSHKFLLSFMFILSLSIANYKGEALRGGLILLGVVFIKFLLDWDDSVCDRRI